MDPLSVTASIIAVLQLTNQVIQYLADVKNAPKECQQCLIEASNLLNPLISLRYRAENAQIDDPWFEQLQKLNVEDGPLDQYEQALSQLYSRLENRDGIREVKRRVLWKFSGKEVAAILARMERLKSLINIALEMDHIKLSHAIKDDTTAIRASLLPLQASAVTLEASIAALQIETLSVKDDTVSIRDALPPLQACTTAVIDSQSLQQHQAIIEWLSPTDFPAQQHDIISRRQDGTGQWFLDSVEFKEWLDGPEKTLFCPGIPGAGKTMMAAVAIDYLYQTTHSDDVGIAYLFCSYKVQMDQSALFAAVLKQLVQGRPDNAAQVMRLYDHHSKRRSKPSVDELIQALTSVCSNYSTVYVIIDALDECSNTDGVRGHLIERMRNLQASSNVRLLLTSRFIPEIIQTFQSNLMLEVRASEEDVRQYIQGQLHRLATCVQRNKELQYVIESKIIEAVDGMFLLARLHVDSLLDRSTKSKILAKLEKLRKGSEALDQAYDDALSRIDGQLTGHRELASRALAWITYAQRPLSAEELCIALAIEPGTSKLDDDNIDDVEQILSVCAGLVTVDEESSIIRLVHYTTQEYLERVRSKWIPYAQEEIATACLTYLSFEVFLSGSCRRDRAFEHRRARNGLFKYSGRYWSEHLRPVESSTSTSELALSFLCDENLVDSAIQAASVGTHKYYGYSQSFPKQSNGLHLTARYGLPYLTKRLLEESNYTYNGTGRMNSKDSYGQTPLSRAAQNGHASVVKILVERDDVEADVKGKSGQTPLSRAAQGGHEAVVKILVERNDVEADSKDMHGQTSLSLAAENGHEKVLKLLVERDDVEADSKDSFGQTPLLWAAEKGHKTIVELLMERDDVEADSRNVYDETPLSWAAQNGHVSVVKLLVGRDDVKADSKDNVGRTPLSRAAEGGHEAIVKQLVARDDVEADSKDNGGRTPLSWAAKEGYEAVVKLLVERDDVEADSKDNENRTPLSWAVRGGYEAVVKLLIERDDVEANSKDKYDRTLLSWATLEEHEGVVKLLVDRDDVEADVKDMYGRTPLSRAVECRTEAIVKLLLARDDVDADSKDNDGRTPLWWAAKVGHEAVVKLLS